MDKCSSKDQKRVFLWAPPRSVSTAFLRAMMNRTSTKVFFEPYARVFYNSPHIPKQYNYTDVKTELEMDYPEYDLIFAKEMARFFDSNETRMKFIPDGYIHTFLIRDPHKTISSLWTGYGYLDESEVGFKELFELFNLVTNVLGQEAVLIDADDLLANPEAMLKLYCNKVGIDYQDSMVNWTEQGLDTIKASQYPEWYGTVISTKSFQETKSTKMMSDLPLNVVDAIEENMLYYKNMYEKRLRLTQNN